MIDNDNVKDGFLKGFSSRPSFSITILTIKTMTTLASRTIQKTKSLTILQRIARKDKTAVKECVDTYGNFIWALARKFTRSREEAEAAAQKIFTDIWRHAERDDQSPSAENLLIALIARRRLIERLH